MQTNWVASQRCHHLVHQPYLDLRELLLRGWKLFVNPTLGFQFFYCFIAVFGLFLASIRILPPLTEFFLKFLNKKEKLQLLFSMLQICLFSMEKQSVENAIQQNKRESDTAEQKLAQMLWSNKKAFSQHYHNQNVSDLSSFYTKDKLLIWGKLRMGF